MGEPRSDTRRLDSLLMTVVLRPQFESAMEPARHQGSNFDRR